MKKLLVLVCAVAVAPLQAGFLYHTPNAEQRDILERKKASLTRDLERKMNALRELKAGAKLGWRDWAAVNLPLVHRVVDESEMAQRIMKVQNEVDVLYDNLQEVRHYLGEITGATKLFNQHKSAVVGALGLAAVAGGAYFNREKASPTGEVSKVKVGGRSIGVGARRDIAQMNATDLDAFIDANFKTRNTDGSPGQRKRKTTHKVAGAVAARWRALHQ